MKTHSLLGWMYILMSLALCSEVQQIQSDIKSILHRLHNARILYYFQNSKTKQLYPRLPINKILAQSKLKAFADHKIKEI